MILKDRRLIVILGMICLISLLVWGCATKSFVLQKTDEVDAKTKTNKVQIIIWIKEVGDTSQGYFHTYRLEENRWAE